MFHKSLVKCHKFVTKRLVLRVLKYIMNLKFTLKPFNAYEQ
jgi:hypothetical protein